jgi:hypothetical protein
LYLCKLQQYEIVTGVVEVEGITPGGDETPCGTERYFSYSLVIFFLSNIFFVSEVWIGDGGHVCW